MYRIIIAGSRDFTDYDKLKEVFSKACDYWNILDPKDIEIVSGGARGADRLGENLALSYGFKLTRIPADWNTHGKSAGYKRNKVMAEYGTHLLAFHINGSKGTGHMINLAMKNHLDVVKYDGNEVLVWDSPRQK